MKCAVIAGGGTRMLPNLVADTWSFRCWGVELAEGSDDLSAISELHGDRLIETGLRQGGMNVQVRQACHPWHGTDRCDKRWSATLRWRFVDESTCR